MLSPQENSNLPENHRMPTSLSRDEDGVDTSICFPHMITHKTKLLYYGSGLTRTRNEMQGTVCFNIWRILTPPQSRQNAQHPNFTTDLYKNSSLHRRAIGREGMVVARQSRDKFVRRIPCFSNVDRAEARTALSFPRTR